MRAREMHPLCCIAVDCPTLPDDDAANDVEVLGALVAAANENGGGSGAAGGTGTAVAGVLYKWTNFRKGWRSRWFSLRRDGVLSYVKLRRCEFANLADPGHGIRQIGNSSLRLVGPIVHIRITSFRESKSDERRFYIFSSKKTLQLRTVSGKDRTAWIEALIFARCSYAVNEKIPVSHDYISLSTEKLRDRMQAEGLQEELIQECEQIMQSEFSEVHRRLKSHYEEQLSLFGTCEGQLQEVNGSLINDERQLVLIKHELSGSRHGKFSEYSTTESSDEIEKQDVEELSDEDEPCFFDTMDCFKDSSANCAPAFATIGSADKSDRNGNPYNMEIVFAQLKGGRDVSSVIKRRQMLPEPIEKERSVSLWSVIKDNVGKDLTRVCLPVYFNEPLSSLQKCFEELEYSYLLDQAYEFGKKGDSLMRIIHVAAFAVSGYASSDGRPCKPFNPLLGETYEADYPDKGVRFFSEKVSHHPTLIACHCEGRGWKFWGDSNLKSKFWGRSIQLDPVGILTLEFDDGEVYQWSKVTTTIYNLILGKVYCEHHGIMTIQGNHQYSCKLKFKEQSLLDRNPRQVQGFVEDVNGNKVASLSGKWDDNMYYFKKDDVAKNCSSTEKGNLLWKRSEPPPNPTRYNLTSFAITLNELTPELQEKLPPTDSRLRPDQRHLEDGEYEKANSEKLRLERRQRMSRKLQENGWQPKWFRRDGETGTYRYVGGYWEAREHGNWDSCPDIFGEFSELNGLHGS